jgi:hypothetical protein
MVMTKEITVVRSSPSPAERRKSGWAGLEADKEVALAPHPKARQTCPFREFSRSMV